MFLLGLLSWVAFLQVKTLGFRHFLFLSFLFFWCHSLQCTGHCGEGKRIMARAQLLIIHLNLEMTRITSIYIPSVGVREMEFLVEQVPPRNDSKLQKGSPDLRVLASHNLLHFSTSIWLQQFSVMIAFTPQRVIKCSFVSHQWWPLTFNVIWDADAFNVIMRSQGM